MFYNDNIWIKGLHCYLSIITNSYYMSIALNLSRICGHIRGWSLIKLFTSDPVLYCLQRVWARYSSQVQLQSKSPTALHTFGHWLVENIQKAVKCLVFSSKKGFDAITFKLADNVYVHNIKLMKRKALRKHSLHEKTAASVLLKLFISSYEWCHTTDAP